MKGKKVLVCGATGFIGGALYSHLKEIGADVMGSLGRDVADLTTRPCCKEILGFQKYDIVYICAGVTGGSGLIASNPLSLVTSNLLIHAHMFDACRDAGVKKVVCLSSTTGYPDTAAMMREEDYFTGELHGSYFNPGHTRRFIERLGTMYPELNITFLRPSVVYGPGDDYDLETCHVIPALVRKVAERQDPLEIWGDGLNWRDAVYIDDVVRALLLCERAPAGAFNLASGQGMTVLQILDTLLKHAGRAVQIRHDMSKPSMLKKRVLSIDKAKRILKWEPKVMMTEGLCMTLEAYFARQ